MGSETTGQGGTAGCFSCFPGPSPSSSAFCQQVFAFRFLKAQLKQQLRGVFLFLKASKLAAASLHPLLPAPGWDFPSPCGDASKFSSQRVGICDSWPIALGFLYFAPNKSDASRSLPGHSSALLLRGCTHSALAALGQNANIWAPP